MKKMIVLFSCAILFASVSNAQDTTSKTKKERIHNLDSAKRQNLKEKGITKENLKDLDLTEDQKKQIDDLHNSAKLEKEKIKNDAALSEDQKQTKMSEIERSSKGKVMGLLTPEQKEKIKQKRAKMKAENPQ